MSRTPEKFAGAVLVALRLARGKRGVGGVAAIVLAVVLYALVVQPLAESRFGLPLPPIAGVELPDGAPRQSSRTEQPTADPTDAPGVLREVGRDAYVSPAGLRYTRGSQHGHRLDHLMSHARDDPDRDGPHGVFDASELEALVLLVDEAYRQAQSGRDTETEREGDRVVYAVDLGRRVGYVGGRTGARRGNPPAEHVRLVLEGDRLITAFPMIP